MQRKETLPPSTADKKTASQKITDMHAKPKKKHRQAAHPISIDQCRDSGMAAVLICLLAAYLVRSYTWVALAICLQVLNMIAPVVYRPFAFGWMGLSRILGTVMSRILLTAIFYALVTPVGLLRRLFGADALNLKQWKTGTGSVFKTRNHRFTADEIEKPY